MGERHNDVLDTCFLSAMNHRFRGTQIEIATRLLHAASRHLIFIDADIGSAAQDVLALFFSSHAQGDVMAGAHPHQRKAWGQLARALASGVTDPPRRSMFTWPPVLNPLRMHRESCPGRAAGGGRGRDGLHAHRSLNFDCFDSFMRKRVRDDWAARRRPAYGGRAMAMKGTLGEGAADRPDGQGSGASGKWLACSSRTSSL